MVGTPGSSMLYRHKHFREKLRSVNDPLFIRLNLGNRLIGTVCFSRRTVWSGEKAMTGYYIRYFTFRESFRSAARQEAVLEKNKKSPVRDEIRRLLNGEGLDEQDPFLFYAYVDPGNLRSARMIHEFGFERISSFYVLPFNRIFTSYDPRVSRIDAGEIPDMKSRLIEFYKDEQLMFLENLFFKGNYFVMRDAGRIVCGAQAIPEEWLIRSMPGLSGKIMLHVFPKIPYANRLFRKDLRFILIEGIFFEPGYEEWLEPLFKSILDHYGLHLAISCLDHRSGAYGAVKNLDPGILKRFTKEIPMDVMVKGIGGARAEKNKPAYISGFDIL